MHRVLACKHSAQAVAPLFSRPRASAALRPAERVSSSSKRPFTLQRVRATAASASSGMSARAAATDEGWTIVGGGRVGEALSKMGNNDVIVRRGETVVDDEGGPIVVCTRNDDLQGVLEATPPERYGDLVFIQNGMLEPWLAERGLADNTQVLVYFAVAKLGDLPIDGKTDVNPEGLTAAYGKHAQTFADRLATKDLSCKVLDKVDFKKSMLEKLVWICSFMLVGVKNGVTVGEVESKHTGEVEDLMRELTAAGSKALDIPEDEGTLPRLMAYARSVAHYPTAIKEFPWRNGYFYGLTQQAEKDGKPDPCPYHTQLLKETGSV